MITTTLVAIPTYNSEIRVELLPFLADAARDDATILPIVRVPLDVARCRAVEEAKKIKADVLIQLDADMHPELGSYQALMNQVTSEACVVACPYKTASGTLAYITPGGIIDLKKATELTAAVPVVMTGLAVSAVNMKVFDRIEAPFFYHTYTENHAYQTDTEDSIFCKAVHKAGIPLYVLGDFWAVHMLVKPVGRPQILKPDQLKFMQDLGLI